MRTSKIYLSRAKARESATTSCVWQVLKKAGGWENFPVEQRGGFRWCSDWRLLAWRCCRGLTRNGPSFVTDWRCTFAFSDWSSTGSGDKNYGSFQLLIKSWSLLANGGRHFFLTAWIVTRVTGLNSHRLDLWTQRRLVSVIDHCRKWVSLLGWLPQVVGKNFMFTYVLELLVYSVFLWQRNKGPKSLDLICSKLSIVPSKT